MLAALLAGATLAHAQSKKELVAKLLQLQQPGIENAARELATRPALQLLQAAGAALQTQVPADRRQAAARALEAEAKQYVDEAAPLMREQALRLAPTAYGAGLEEKFSEDELRQLIAWHESPVSRKYQQAMPELQNAFAQQLIAAVGPQLDPKIQALQQKMRATLAAAAGAVPHRRQCCRAAWRRARPRAGNRPRSDATICCPWLNRPRRPLRNCWRCAPRSTGSTANCWRC
ncbi:MAG: DUF2059 domain-containing protein [Piscinibacter sp.]|nr:DUF2059 domain-containing protein [Piscinibacter sp.]